MNNICNRTLLSCAICLGLESSKLPRTLKKIQEDVREQIGKEDPKLPMDSSPYEDSRRDMMAKCSLANCADLHVVKVAGKLEGVRKMTNHASNQGKCAGLFFVRLLKKDKEGELEAIKSHASKTTEDEKELQDMYMVFQPRSFRRPTFMKDLPHLDMNTLHEDLEIIATILWHLPMELQGDCIVSGVAPEHDHHPIRQNGIDVKHVTQHYHWAPNGGWTNKLQRVRRTQKSKVPQGAAFSMPWEWYPGLPMYGNQLGAYGMPPNYLEMPFAGSSELSFSQVPWDTESAESASCQAEPWASRLHAGTVGGEATMPVKVQPGSMCSESFGLEALGCPDPLKIDAQMPPPAVKNTFLQYGSDLIYGHDENSKKPYTEPANLFLKPKKTEIERESELGEVKHLAPVHS